MLSDVFTCLLCRAKPSAPSAELLELSQIYRIFKQSSSAFVENPLLEPFLKLDVEIRAVEIRQTSGKKVGAFAYLEEAFAR